MAGLFDNLGANIAGGLSGFGGVLGGIGRGLAGAQNYNTMSQAMGDPRAALMAQTNPQAFQTMIFMQQLRDWQQRNPGKDINEALYKISPKGQEEQYGRPPGIVNAGEGVSVPAYMVQPPNGQPSQISPPQQAQGPGTSPMQQIIGPLQDLGIAAKAKAAGAEETSRKQADRLDQYHGALADAQDTVSKLEAFKNNPDRPSIIGGLLGGFGRLGPVGQKQADLVNQNDELQSKIMNSVRTLGGIATGRQMTPGTIKEMSVGAGDLIAARKGTLEGHTQTIDNAIDLIKKRTQAAWEATGKNGEQPTWGQATPKLTPPAPAIAHLKANPQLRSQFDAKYGAGSSAAFVGQ